MSFIFFNFPFYILSILSPSPSITFIFYDLPLYLYLFPPYPFKIFLKLNVFIFRIVFQANISFTGYVKINHLFCTFTFLSHLSFPLIPFNHQVSKIFWLVRFFSAAPPPSQVPLLLIVYSFLFTNSPCNKLDFKEKFCAQFKEKF